MYEEEYWGQEGEVLWEKWSTLVCDSFYVACSHERECEKTGLTVTEMPKLHIPSSLRKRADAINATWVVDHQIKPEEKDPAAEVFRRQHGGGAPSMHPGRDEVCPFLVQSSQNSNACQILIKSYICS